VLKLELSYRGLLLIGLALLALWILRELWTVILLLLVALIFFAALLPYVEWLVKRGVPRVLSVFLVLLAIIAVLGGAIAVVAPAVIDQFEHVRDNLPDDARKLEDSASDLGFDTEDWDLPEKAEDINWEEVISGRAAVDVGQRVVFGVISAFTVIVLTAYLLIEMPRMHAFLYRFVPREREREADDVLQALGRVVGGYVRGQFITSLIIALYTLAVLLFADVDNPVAYAVLAGFADVIPLVGAFIATVPATFAAFQDSPTKPAIVLGLLLLYQQFEDRYLVPRVYGATLNLPPLVVLVAVLIGADLLGITGVLLALPAAAAGRVAFDYAMERRGPPAGPPPGEEILAPDPEPGAANV
jgi:predicted PurR-regulated permease PerM